MKIVYVIVFFIILSGSAFGQNIYRADRESYKANKYIHDFYLYDDSVCYIKEYYSDFGGYRICKGKISKKNDTLFEFSFKPIVNFSCSKRYRRNDNVMFTFTQTDTSISPAFNIKVINKNWQSIVLDKHWTNVYVKGISKETFFIDTKFVDPLTKEKIIVRMNNTSGPDLTYYGTNTQSETLKVSIRKNMLTIYPDKKFFFFKETFLLITQ